MSKIKIYTKNEFYREVALIYKEWSIVNSLFNYQDYKLLYFSNSNYREKVIEEYLKEMKWQIQLEVNRIRLSQGQEKVNYFKR